MNISKEKNKKLCWICKARINPFMSFGKMPIANNFLPKEDFDTEYFFEMEPAFCSECHMFQLINQPEPEQMFNEHYAFFSGTSEYMKTHFKNFSQYVLENVGKDPFIVEIGSNDGIMLQNFAKRNIRHLGVEPSKNVAEVAKNKGINTIIDFFNKETAEKIVREEGKADAFIAANVMCHIPYMNSILEGIDVLLKDDGVVIFEDPYLGDVIEKTTYDQIYDEHTFLFSAGSIKFLFNLYDMELIDLIPQTTHGGSMRYVIARKGKKEIKVSVGKILKKENTLGLSDYKTYLEFKSNCEFFRSSLLNLIQDIKKNGKSIAGYAATSKSTTITNYCGINSSHLDCIFDTTPIKQGKYSPGTHIPIRSHEEFRENYPDYALLFGYNHQEEIFSKENEFIEQGGKWLLYVPEIKIYP